MTTAAGDAVAWLERRRLPVPAELRAAAASGARGRLSSRDRAKPGSDPEVEWVVGVLSGLREREKRSVARYCAKQAEARRANAQPPTIEAVSSDDDEPAPPAGSAEGIEASPPPPACAWPAGFRYTHEYAWAPDVPAATRAECAGTARPARRAPVRSRAVEVRRITDGTHPACGEHGLFAARRLAYGARALDYVGAVSTAEGEDRSSDYVCEFGADGELALDALRVGNEARFINDFRNTGRRPNVEFRLRRSARAAEMRQGVYVCAKEGVRAGDELLISYGKPFWRARVDGSLEDFVTQRPAQSPSAEPEAP